MMDQDEAEELWVAFIKSNEIAESTVESYEYAFQKFSDFLRDTGADWTDFEKGTDVVVDLPDERTTIRSSNSLGDYFIKWMRADHEHGIADSTARTYANGVKAFVSFLDDEEYIDSNSFAEMAISDYVSDTDTLQKERYDEDYVTISPEQYELLLENPGTPAFRNRLLFEMAWKTGMRRSELAELEVSDVLVNERKINVPDTKTDDHPPVFFGTSLGSRITRWVYERRESYVTAGSSNKFFVSNHEASLTGGQINNIVVEAAERAGFQEYDVDANDAQRARYTAHSFRHGFATQFISGGSGETDGGDLYALKDILGHASVSTTERYLNPGDEYIRSQMLEHGPD